jgi:hypothetical protein
VTENDEVPELTVRDSAAASQNGIQHYVTTLNQVFRVAFEPGGFATVTELLVSGQGNVYRLIPRDRVLVGEPLSVRRLNGGIVAKGRVTHIVATREQLSAADLRKRFDLQGRHGR